jgi:putative membrane protein
VRPDPYAWFTHLHALVGVVALAAAYVAAVRRRPRELWRAACFAGAILLLLAAAITPLEALQFHLLSAHLLQNVILAEWAPALLVLSVPTDVATRLGAVPLVRMLTFPGVALPLWLLVYFAWHVPPAYEAALERPDTLLHLEHLSYLVAGCLFWWPALRDEAGFSLGARAGYVFAAFVLAGPLGLLLALLPDAVYGYYEDAPRLWGLSALEDQQIAGVTMSVEQALVFFTVFVLFFTRFLAAEAQGDGYAADRGRS